MILTGAGNLHCNSTRRAFDCVSMAASEGLFEARYDISLLSPSFRAFQRVTLAKFEARKIHGRLTSSCIFSIELRLYSSSCFILGSNSTTCISFGFLHLQLSFEIESTPKIFMYYANAHGWERFMRLRHCQAKKNIFPIQLTPLACRRFRKSLIQECWSIKMLWFIQGFLCTY